MFVQKKTTVARIAAHSIQQQTGCWDWQLALTPDGYGKLSVGGRNLQAHRVAYENMVGPIPPGLTIDHLCRNRRCVNPKHLEPVSRGENTLRGESPTAKNAVKTHCPAGHPYDEGNTYRYRGGRGCRICIAARNSRAARKARAAISKATGGGA